MQRLYSTFPRGWHGATLLLLRAAIGITLIVQGAAAFPEWQDLHMASFAISLLSIVSGVSLVLGLLTPIACGLAVLGGLAIVLFSPPSAVWNFFYGNPLDLDVLIMVVVCGLLGPGAYSLDAHFFGRRKVVIPRSPLSQAGISSPLHSHISTPSHLHGSSATHVPNSPTSQSR